MLCVFVDCHHKSSLPPGTVGVAAVTAGPGLTNTVTAVKNAQMAESPLLLMGGAAGTLLQVEHVSSTISPFVSTLKAQNYRSFI